MTAWRACGAAVLCLLLAACGDKKPQPAGPGGDAPAADLVATWQTRGQDADLGSVEVRMALRDDGTLRLTVSPDAGGSLSFAGTWEVAGERLRLRGAWFQPDGEVDVAWRRTGDELVLTDADGQAQTWERVP